MTEEGKKGAIFFAAAFIGLAIVGAGACLLTGHPMFVSPFEVITPW